MLPAVYNHINPRGIVKCSAAQIIMNSKNKSHSLIDRYYTFERITLTVSLLLIFWEVFGLDKSTAIPFLDVVLKDPSKFPHATFFILTITVIFNVIEWKQSSPESRKQVISRVRFALILSIASVSVWINYSNLTDGTTLEGINRLWYIFYLCLGNFIGHFTSILILATLAILTKEESIKLSLPRVPIASMCQYRAWVPALCILFVIYFVVTHYAPIELLPFIPLITGVPIVAILMGDVMLYFFSKDAEGHAITYRQKISQFKEIFSTHQHSYFLIEKGEEETKKYNFPQDATPQQKQEIIKQHHAFDSNNVELRSVLLDELKLELYPKDGNRLNRSLGNFGIRFEGSDQKAKGIRVQVYPKEENPPKSIKELVLPFDVLGKKATEYIKTNLDDQSFDPDFKLVEFALNRSVEEVLSYSVEQPLHEAAGGGANLTIIQALIENGYDINEKGAFGWTPIMIAAANGHTEIVKYLLEHGADPDIANLHKRTPLTFAARYGNIQIADLLLDYGANIDCKCSNGCTPLAMAVEHGNEEMVNFLLSNGASTEVKNRRGKKALDVAYEKGHGNIARLLKKRKKKKVKGFQY